MTNDGTASRGRGGQTGPAPGDAPCAVVANARHCCFDTTIALSLASVAESGRGVLTPLTSKIAEQEAGGPPPPAASAAPAALPSVPAATVAAVPSPRRRRSRG